MKNQIKFSKVEAAKSFNEYCNLQGSVQEKEDFVILEYDSVKAEYMKEEMVEKYADMYRSIYNEMDRRFEYLHNQVEVMNKYIYEWMRKHEKGHLPSTNSPSELQQAINVLGLEGSYDVQKEVIYASSKDGYSLEATVKKY